MISGLAKSEAKLRENQVFATAMSFSDEPIEVSVSDTTKATLASYGRKRAKKNRTNR